MDSLTPTVTYRIPVLSLQSREGEREKEVSASVGTSDEEDSLNLAPQRVQEQRLRQLLQVHSDTSKPHRIQFCIPGQCRHTADND